MKHYSGFVNSAGKMILCDREGYAIREMTENEEKKYRYYHDIFGYVPFSDEELEEGARKIKEKEKV